MGYTAPTTRSTGNLITASVWNTDLVDNITFLANPPACRVYNTANQSVTSGGSGLLIPFNTERYDTDNMHSTVTNTSRITFNTAGLYLVTAHIQYAGNATGIRLAAIRFNGATDIAYDIRMNAGASDTTAFSIATVYKFAAADYVEVLAFQSSGSTLNVFANANYSPEFSATWVGRG